MTTNIKAWSIARTDNTLFDDGVYSTNGDLLFVYPIFLKKKHALQYKKDTYGAKYLKNIAKVIPVVIKVL